MDLQYVRDVADIFIQCLFSPAEGAHVFNLRGEVVGMEALRRMLDEIRPGAATYLCLWTGGSGCLPDGRFSPGANDRRSSQDTSA